MEAEASLEAPSGKCKKHGRGCVFNTLGHVGESPGGDFFQSGSPDLFWKDPGEHFGRFFRILVMLEVRLGSIFQQNMQLFGEPNFNEFLVYFWEGPAAGAGLI